MKRGGYAMESWWPFAICAIPAVLGQLTRIVLLRWAERVAPFEFDTDDDTP